MTSFLKSDRSPATALWLFTVALVVLGMIIVGGATRLTGSGLSITEWKPVTGVIPPLGDAAWREAFAEYQRIPQYRFINHGMSLDAFKGIYWWEWTHRLLGRVLGVVFLLPFVVLAVARRLPSRLIWRCVVLFLLGGLQGAVGWWMVQSGLEGRVSVAPERLATHLGLALILYCGLIWTAWEAWAGPPRSSYQPRWALAAIGLTVLVFFQSLLGALVAGNQAGLIYNDWPLMAGRVFPKAYLQGSLWHSLLHSQAAVQFDHRIGAYLLLALAIGLAFAANRAPLLAQATRRLFVIMGVLTTLQACLGVATLMARAPLALSAPHQFGAAIVLAAAVTLAWRSQRA